MDLEKLLTPNILHDDPGSDVMWTRVNVGEATPGTVTPLTADFQRPANLYPAGRMYHRMGLLAHPVIPEFGGTQMTCFFCGKIAINLDTLRWLMDRTPGITADEFEASILGNVRDNVVSKPYRLRYPIAFAKIAWLVKTLPAENANLGRTTTNWWRSKTETLKHANIEESLKIFSEARNVYESVIDHAGLVASLSPAFMAQLARPVEKLGSQEDVLTIASGFGNVKETEMLDRLWRVAKNEESLEEFLTDYGYMCPSGAELESLSWRENNDLLNQILEVNASAPESERPTARFKKTQQRATKRKAELLSNASVLTKAEFRIGYWFASRLIPIREVGKACMFMAPDVGRAAARNIGQYLLDKGSITCVDDVFYLSFEEIMSSTQHSDQYGELAAERRELRRQYDQIELPDFFTSEQLRELIWTFAKNRNRGDQSGGVSPTAQPGDVIEGAAASPGKVTGRARVISDPSNTDGFSKGDILICKVTDPGWAALFSIAGALVADVGGMLSHSAIIAREIGIPAVVNTRNGTRRIPDGAIVTVDGASGTVTIEGDELALLNKHSNSSA